MALRRCSSHLYASYRCLSWDGKPIFLKCLLSWSVVCQLTWDQCLFIINSYLVICFSRHRHNARLNVFTNFTQLKAEEPYSPYIRAGNYITAGKTLLDGAETNNRDAVFGTDETPRTELPELLELFFDDACKMPKSRFEELNIDIDDYYFKYCDVIADGMMKTGLYAMWLDVIGKFCLYPDRSLSLAS